MNTEEPVVHWLLSDFYTTTLALNFKLPFVGVEKTENFDTAAAISLLEITELDVSKTSAADMQGSTTRADGES
ncbi:unnamed protein product [Prunus armeniaca]